MLQLKNKTQKCMFLYLLYQPKMVINYYSKQKQDSKKIITWNKYMSEMSKQSTINYLNSLIDPIFNSQQIICSVI